MRTEGGLAYRESGLKGDPVALLVHGYPESSYMWRGALLALAEVGWHAFASRQSIAFAASWASSAARSSCTIGAA